MKQIFYLVLTTVCINISSCTKRQIPIVQKSTLVTVIDDPTDPRKLRLQPDPILAIYGFSDIPDQEAYFRFTFVTDRRLNPVVEYHLASGLVTESNNKFDDPDYRGKLIKLFYGKVRKTFADYHGQYDSVSSMPFSECYRTFVNELTHIAVCSATHKCLIMHSDLREKSDAFDCYSEYGRQLMETNPQQIRDTLLKSCPLPDNISNITIVFVFSALTREEERQFLEMAEVYKLLLEPRHARVIVQADNRYFNIQ